MTGALVVAVTCGFTGASCADEVEVTKLEPNEAGADTSASAADANDEDAGAFDSGAEASVGDAGAFDGGPRPVVCGAPPCATDLVTTMGAYDSDPAEGFCALLSDRTVVCWGANGAGQLGRGDDGETTDSPTAERVTGLSNVSSLRHTCAIDESGAAWCWGTGPFLQNDAGEAMTANTPTQLALPPVKSVDVGSQTGCALANNDVLCWGYNSYGQIASFDDVSILMPVLPRAIAMPTGMSIREIFLGKSTIALREDGTAASWGFNASLGRASTLSPDPYPTDLLLKGISSIDLTPENGCATASGVGYCWGLAVVSPEFKRLGPEAVPSPEPLVQIATTRAFAASDLGGSVQRRQRWCAVGASGAVYCWGDNGSGQAGDGTKVGAYDAPVKVEGLPGPASRVSTMPDATCALLSNGKIHCWGSNYYGQLGNGRMRVPSLVPQEVVLP